MTSDDLLQSLPLEYRVCPFITRYSIPGFRRYSDGVGFSFCPEPIAMDDWYKSFVARVRSALGRSFLPVCRLADGEFRMLFWPVPPNPRLPPSARVRSRLATAWHALRMLVYGFRANTAPDVPSGRFGVMEWHAIRRRSGQRFLKIGQEGILALHIGVAVEPFHEEYFAALKRWLDRGHLELTLENCVPFYFVYALLRGPDGQFLFDGTRVLVIHSADGDRRARICEAILGRGARQIGWIQISQSRSFHDTLDVSSSIGRYDVCLVGAGIGKALVIDQLRPLNIPVLDAGFVFEAWCDESRARDRVCMIPDA